MKALFSFVISLYLLQAILCDCYNENPTSVSDCENAKSGDEYCCYVTFRNNRDPAYRSICIPVKEDDIEDGKFEETMGNIEGGNYTASGWNDAILENFRDYSSIDNFDCKGNYLSNIMMLCSLLFIIFLI